MLNKQQCICTSSSVHTHNSMLNNLLRNVNADFSTHARLCTVIFCEQLLLLPPPPGQSSSAAAAALGGSSSSNSSSAAAAAADPAAALLYAPDWQWDDDTLDEQLFNFLMET
jgi:hypothetical protein